MIAQMKMVSCYKPSKIALYRIFTIARRKVSCKQTQFNTWPIILVYMSINDAYENTSITTANVGSIHEAIKMTIVYCVPLIHRRGRSPMNKNWTRCQLFCISSAVVRNSLPGALQLTSLTVTTILRTIKSFLYLFSGMD